MRPCTSIPNTPFAITMEEPRVSAHVAGKAFIFIIDTGASWSVLPSYSGKIFPSQLSVVGVDGKTHSPKSTGPFPCVFWDIPLTYSFLVMPSCPSPLLGRDLMQKVSFTLSLPSPPSNLPSYFRSSLLLSTLLLAAPASEVNPTVWDTSTPGLASHHAPVRIALKDPSVFPCRAQYPIALKHRVSNPLFRDCSQQASSNLPTPPITLQFSLFLRQMGPTA